MFVYECLFTNNITYVMAVSYHITGKHLGHFSARKVAINLLSVRPIKFENSANEIRELQSMDLQPDDS